MCKIAALPWKHEWADTHKWPQKFFLQERQTTNKTTTGRGKFLKVYFSAQPNVQPVNKNIFCNFIKITASFKSNPNLTPNLNPTTNLFYFKLNKKFYN